MQVEPEVKSIPGVTFLNSPVEISEGIDVISKEAHDDMLGEIPPDLQSKGEIFMKKAEEKINKLQETLKSTVQVYSIDWKDSFILSVWVNNSCFRQRILKLHVHMITFALCCTGILSVEKLSSIPLKADDIASSYRERK